MRENAGDTQDLLTVINSDKNLNSRKCNGENVLRLTLNTN